MKPTAAMCAIVNAEAEVFKAQLPDLLKKHRGKWVLFRDGRPVDFFDDYEDALIAGLEKFGREAVFLIACVEPPSSFTMPMISWRMAVEHVMRPSTWR